MTKTEEIKVLQSLKGDTYFAQVFPNNVIDQMCENIKMDFALDNGIEIFEYSSAVKMYKGKVRELRQNIGELMSENEAIRKMNNELLEMLVISSLSAGWSYDSKEYKHVASLVGLKYIILAKIKHGYALTDKEKEYLTNNLK